MFLDGMVVVSSFFSLSMLAMVSLSKAVSYMNFKCLQANNLQPEERTDISDLLSGGGQALVTEVLNGSLNFGLEERVRVQGVGLEDVLAGAKFDSALLNGARRKGRADGGEGEE